MRMLLGIAGLMLMWCYCAAGSAQPVAPMPARVPAGVTGHGETVKTAKEAALRKAIAEIKTALNVQSLVIKEDYVAKNVLVDEGQPGKDVPADERFPDFKTWELTFRTDKAWWTDIVRRDLDAQREIRKNERKEWASLTFLGLTILLLAGVGYVRLNEFTQRRYTTWLRLAGISAITTMIAGIWWAWLAP